MKTVAWLAVALFLAWVWFPGPSSAFLIFPFDSIGPDEDQANGIQFFSNYPDGNRLFLTTGEGFHSYNYDTSQWEDHTWPDWIGKRLNAVVPVPGQPGRLALGGVNAFFKGVLKLSVDDGGTDDLVYESTGGSVTDMALAPFNDPTIYACTWSDVANGELLRSDDGGESYYPLFGHGHQAMTGVEAITDTEVYVSGDNYVTRTLDGGLTWENLQGNLPEGEVVHCLHAPQPVTGLPDLQSPSHKDEPFIYAGFLLVSTDSGVYGTSAHEIDWELILPEACRALAYRFVQVSTFVYWSEYYAVTFDGRLLVCLNQNWNNWTDATEMLAPGVPIDVVTEFGPVYVATAAHGVYATSGIDGLSPVLPPAPGLTLSARPNPFNPVTELLFSVPQDGYAVIEVFDLAGRKVAEVYEGNVEAGSHGVSWQPRGLSSGVYHAVLRQGNHRATVRVTLVK